MLLATFFNLNEQIVGGGYIMSDPIKRNERDSTRAAQITNMPIFKPLTGSLIPLLALLVAFASSFPHLGLSQLCIYLFGMILCM